MKRQVLWIAVLIIAFSAFGEEQKKQGCEGICVGAVIGEGQAEIAQTNTEPELFRVSDRDLAAAGAAMTSMSAEQRLRTVLVMTTEIATEIGGADALTAAEAKAKNIIEWARLHGPFDTLALEIGHSDPAVVAYTIKRVAVGAQGLDAASQIALRVSSLEPLQSLLDQGALAYVDALVVDAEQVAPTAAWLAEKDPAKKIFALVTPQSPNAMYDLAAAIAAGARRAYLAGPIDTSAIANFNRALSGDFAFDSTAQTAVLDVRGNTTQMPAITFVRGEDLRTIIVPRGDAAEARIIALPVDRYKAPGRVDAAGERVITDTGRKGGRLLVGLQPSSKPYLLYANYADKVDANVTKETIDIATQRGITVEEIIRNHQAYDAWQESIQPRYIARNTTKLRFDIGNGADALEATIAGPYFSDPTGRADWVWQDFFLNGVKWKYGRIPELPLIQPEKVTQLPLDLHLTNEYRYELVRETDLLGYRVYEVRFEPPPNAPIELPLYRGTVFIDTKSWARIRIVMVQLNLSGEVLSNEERIEFQPFSRETSQPATSADVARLGGRSIMWLPLEVTAQQVISAAGRANAIQRSTSFSEFRINPEDYDTRLREVSASESLMVRETNAGMRYLEKRGEGERVVKEGFDTSQTFMLGGIHHDAGLEYPVVPLGGIDYFNFDLMNRGIQTNVFFAGVIVAANATHPNVGNTRTNVGAEFFGIALPFENTMYRSGEEQPGEGVKALPLVLTARAGHPVFTFGKIDLSFTAAHLTYQRAENTEADFEVPSDTFLFGPSVQTQYSRRGVSFSAFYDWTTRTTWEPWGDLTEFDPDQKTFTKFGASIGKSFFLPNFQRLGIDVNYLDGIRLDRFSKYELGFFGAQRVHGVRSGSVRAEKAIIGHLSYGFVFSQQFRIEAFYDHALIDDLTAGLQRETFQGLGLAGQTVGPYGTLVRLDIGKTIGRNAQDGFVANVVFLKLF
ncbi:MAG: hypothetical protein JJE51_05000 [Thermoanaerobaculia bacterium]|nr:hypothetical protein [Thermoanaerobaculia bacterium]